MRINALILPAITGLLVLSAPACERGNRASSPETRGTSCTRIVSLAPNITETLFALGLGDRVAGVTRFCEYPPEARKKPKVGGFLDINYEALAALRPDLVILLAAHGEAQEKLAALGIKTLTVRNETVGDILGTVNEIGKICDAPARADSITRGIETRMAAIRKRTEGLPRPRVLIVVDRTMGNGIPGAVCVAGPETFYDELITLAGGTNAYRGPKIPYPQVSPEGITRLDPEIIIDIVPPTAGGGISTEAARACWMRLDGVSAARTGRVHILSGSYAAVPGPRFIELLEKLAALIQPEQAAIRTDGAS